MISIGIIGGSGYTGGEILRILLNHEKVEIKAVTSREYAGEPVFRAHPHLRKITDMKFVEPDLEKIVSSCDIVFLAVPHGTATPMVKRLLEAGVRVIDLSADF
ncbi:MAG: Gfo/Idh/MocA family oxidoreductase, partial [Candidatus Methanomethyliaceae archaeon]|nr:Gfo/Idh/MocA family oxidoreductase [Candidatus Methanomethyliaceae archaeon]